MENLSLLKCTYQNNLIKPLIAIVQNLGTIDEIFKNNNPELITDNSRNAINYQCSLDNKKMIISDKQYQSMKRNRFQLFLINRLIDDNQLKEGDILLCLPFQGEIKKFNTYRYFMNNDGCYDLNYGYPLDNNNSIQLKPNVFVRPLSLDDYSHFIAIDKMINDLDDIQNDREYEKQILLERL